MTFDLAECKIRSPNGDALRHLCQFLMDQFPSDRPVLEPVLQAGRQCALWTPYVLYHGSKLLGNVSLMRLQIWLDNRLHKVVGVASVATHPHYRRMGVAQRLLDRCMKMVDQQGLCSVLFTSLPTVYERSGFRTVEQVYLGTNAAELPGGESPFSVSIVEKLNETICRVLDSLYSSCGAAYSGKLQRDADYWDFYRRLYNSNPNATILLGSRDGRPCCYARCELEKDRLLVSEICADSTETVALEALWTRIGKLARERRSEWVTLGLPRAHMAHTHLVHRGTALKNEPAGAPREALMIRPPRGESLGSWGRLQWPLSDKF